MSYVLTCKCCDHTEDMDTPRKAFDAGWDEPVHLPSWPISCPLCPGTASMGLLDHSEAHEKWKQEGRPEHFTPEGLRDLDGTPFAPDLSVVETLLENLLANLKEDK